MPLAWRKASNIARAYIWSVVGWMALAPVMAGQEKAFAWEHGTSDSYWMLLAINGAWCMTAALLTPPVFWIGRRFPLTRPIKWRRIMGYTFGAVPFIFVSICLRWILLPPFDETSGHFKARTLHGLLRLFAMFGDQVWDYLVILVGAHAYSYFVRARDQEIEHAELQQALAASELQALKTQIHPHFMFNTLQGISTLIDEDKSRAKAMILRVSSLLRAVLQYDNSDLVCLDDELEFVEDYLELEKMRLEDRLELRWDIHPDTRLMLVPQLVLQPLVENAIVHGAACCRAGGWVEIGTRLVDGTMEIQIRNSVGLRREPGMGLGLKNARARMKYLYANGASFGFEIGQDDVATARIVVPAIPAQNQASKIKSA